MFLLIGTCKQQVAVQFPFLFQKLLDPVDNVSDFVTLLTHVLLANAAGEISGALQKFSNSVKNAVGDIELWQFGQLLDLFRLIDNRYHVCV